MTREVKLSAMMFIEYAMFSVWWLQLASYLDYMSITGLMKSCILSSIAIGCMFSPIVGMFADRFFRSERFLCFLYILFGVNLIASGFVSNAILIFILLCFAMVFYIPTWALSNAIVMNNASPEKFPIIRMFGSVGWAFSAIFSVVAIYCLDIKKFDGTSLPLITGGCVAFIGAFIALYLPKTLPPAKGKKFSLIDALGFRAFGLMKDRNFCIFIICSFLALIPFSLYWSFFSTFLKSKGFAHFTLTTNISQVSQIIVMPFLMVMINRWGIKKVLLVGLFAMFCRYIFLYIDATSEIEPFIYLGIVMHGFVYVNFFIGGQMYVNTVASKDIRSQAQGLVFLVQFGIGLFVGTFVNGEILSRFSSVENGITIYNWESIWKITWMSCIILFILFAIFFKEKKEETKISI